MSGDDVGFFPMTGCIYWLHRPVARRPDAKLFWTRLLRMKQVLRKVIWEQPCRKVPIS